jgi:hypothetical protein
MNWAFPWPSENPVRVFLVLARACAIHARRDRIPLSRIPLGGCVKMAAENYDDDRKETEEFLPSKTIGYSLLPDPA